MINIFQPSLGAEELEAISNVFESNWIGKGEQVELFERSFASLIKEDVSHLTSTTSCTEAIFLASELFNFTKKDEIIVPSISFVAVGSAVVKSGAKLVISDVDRHSLNITPKLLENSITPATKAVIVNHYGGYSCEIEEIANLCQKKKIILIEDSACALNSTFKGKALGTFGDMGFWSFDPMKMISTGDGGMIYLKDLDLMKSAKENLYLGLEPRKKTGLDTANSKNSNWWEIEINAPGRRAIMNNISAAIGNIQIEKLEEFTSRRRTISEIYRKELSSLKGIFLPPRSESYAESSNYFFWLQLDKRNELAKYLLEKGIYTTFRYWPLNKISYFKKERYELSSSDWASQHTLNIPIHQSLPDNDVFKIVESIKVFDTQNY